MARIGLIDKAGDLHSLAHRLDREGHAVRYFIQGNPKDPDLVKIGHGIVHRVDSIEDAIRGVDAVVAYGLPKEADELKAAGVPIWGSSVWAARLEDDRAYAHELCEKSGIRCPEHHEFDDAKEAAAFAKKHDDRAWVFKAEGKVEATTTHVCKTPEELDQVLESEGSNPEIKRFILEEFIEGVEVSTEGWFDYRQGGWLLPFNSTLERKRFGAGDVGPNVGCMGSIVWGWPNGRGTGGNPQGRGALGRLPQAVLLPMTRALMDTRYVGPFDHNAILKDGEPYVLEPTPRLGWDAFEALGTMIGGGHESEGGDLGEFVVALAQGKARSVPVSSPWGTAIRVFMPIKPEKVRERVPYPALDIPEGGNFWLKDVFRDGKTLRSTQTEPNFGFTIVAEVADAGEDLEEVLGHLYEHHLPALTIDGAYYRTDIGEKAKEDLRQLARWGYEVPWPKYIGDEKHRSELMHITMPRTRLTGRMHAGM